MKLPIILLIFGQCWTAVTSSKNPCGRAKRAIDDSSNESESTEDECNFSSINDNWSRRLSQLSSRTFLRQWWKGPNVCQREENEEESATNVPPESSYHFESCRETERSRRCTQSSLKNSTLVKRAIIHECCPGFVRKYGDVGCPQSFQLKSLQDTLADMNLTTFLEATRQAKLFDQITDDGNYTIFAPSNEAFEKSNDDGEISFVTLSSNDNMQFPREILASHIVARRLDYDSLENEKNIPSLKQGAVIRPVFYSGRMPFSQISTVNCVPLVKADRQTKNGFVHVIDHVMPEATRSLYQILKGDSRFSTFLSLANEEILNSLDDPKTRFTVFAFTDEGFRKLPVEAQERIKNKASCTSNLIHNHIVGPTMCSSSLVFSRSLKTSNGRRLYFKYNKTSSVGEQLPSIVVNDRNLINRDKVATNGVLHVVEGPILFTDNMETLQVLSLLGYDELAQALKINPILEALSNSNFTTLFVPPIEVVQQVLDTNDSNAKENFLTNLVVDPSFVDRSTIRMLSNNKYPMSGYKIGCSANIIRFRDVFTCNGIIRFLDNALPTASGRNIMEILENDPDLSQFTSLVKTAGTKASQFANNSNSLTLLALSNDALKNSMTEEQYEDLLKNRESSLRFVNRHIIKGSACCGQLTETTFGGRKLSSLRPYYRRMLAMRNPKVKRCNNLATNGIVHVIDASTKSFFDSDFIESFFDNASSFFDLSF
uniref:FAS1 domain-containing protein n=1 Tax=Romanomermis culicivorax TaxID=13658 RepID=A0A915HQZ6_ROMCU